MRVTHWLIVSVAAAAGCNSQDADCLGKLGVRLSQAAGGLLANGKQRLLSQWPGGGIEGRVSQRLQWDKALADQAIQVQAVEGIIELRGQAASEEQRRRAIDLAEATLGVDQVRDLLEVPLPKEPASAP